MTTPDGTFDAQDDYSYTVSVRVASLQKAGIMTTYKGEFEAAAPLTRAEADEVIDQHVCLPIKHQRCGATSLR